MNLSNPGSHPGNDRGDKSSVAFDGPLGPSQIREFDEVGGVTFDSGISPALIDATSELVARLDAAGQLGGPCDYRTDPEFCDLIQTPILEQAAMQMLRSQDVVFASKLAMQTRPQPGKPFGLVGEHTDINWTLDDLDSTPRRMCCTFLIWLTDVTPDRGPFMYRPGSHRVIAKFIQGKPLPPAKHRIQVGVPALEYAQPVPMLARKGQISMVTTSTVHSASIVTGPLPRRVMFINFIDRSQLAVDFYGAPEMYEANMQHHRELARLFRPERRHLLTATEGS